MTTPTKQGLHLFMNSHRDPMVGPIEIGTHCPIKYAWMRFVPRVSLGAINRGSPTDFTGRNLMKKKPRRGLMWIALGETQGTQCIQESPSTLNAALNKSMIITTLKNFSWVTSGKIPKPPSIFVVWDFGYRLEILRLRLRMTG
jgi:hypothetical protein